MAIASSGNGSLEPFRAWLNRLIKVKLLVIFSLDLDGNDRVSWSRPAMPSRGRSSHCVISEALSFVLAGILTGSDPSFIDGGLRRTP